MTLEKINEIVSQWYTTGYISNQDREALKQQYLDEVGAQPGCTICPDFYRDVQIHFRILLKQNGFQMKNNRKYMIAEGGHIRLFGQSKLIVNDGENNDSTEVLTDAKAEQLLKQYPELSEQIIENPDYESPAVQAAKATEKGKEKPLTAKEKKALEEQAEKEQAEKE